MKKWIQNKIPRKIIPVLIILLAILPYSIPFFIYYNALSHALPSLPNINFNPPGWFVPAGFISIALIMMLAFSYTDSEEDE